MALEPRVFVSYARADGENFAADLTQRIDTAGVPVWRDREGLRGDQGWWNQIERVLDQVEFLVIVMTPEAVESDVVRKEWEVARRKGVCIFPVIASDKLAWDDMPIWMRKGHCYDLKYQWLKFINDLNTRCEKIRVPFMVEALPENYVARDRLFNDLIRLLVDEERGNPKAITTVLRGAGGFGKTTLARGLCHDIRTRNVFYDGILWVTLGEKPSSLAAKVEDLIYALSNERPGFTEVVAASNRLRELIQEKNVLIVIDDVWREADARPFLVGGSGCGWLLTTRNRDTLPSNAEEVAVDQMQAEEAVRLLGAGLSFSEQPAAVAQMTTFARRLGEWPILLSLVNRVVLDRVQRRRQPLSDALAEVRTKLDRQGLLAFDRRNAKERDVAVAKTIEVSLEQLQQDGEFNRTRFQELAIFPEDANIPVAAVAKLWSETAQLDDLDTKELCNRLFDLSLLQSYDLPTQTIRLHDVVRAYLRTRSGVQAEIGVHRRFVEAYRKTSSGKWETLANDGYIHEHIVYHLFSAGLIDEGYGIINAAWRQAQFRRAGSDRAFAADVESAIAEARRESPPNLFQLIRCCYVYATLGAQATKIAPEAFGALCRLGDTQRAIDYASLIQDPINRAHAYCLIANALVARKELAQARHALDRAYESAESIDRLSPKSVALSEVAQSFANAGEVARAGEVAAASRKAAQDSSFEYVRTEDLLSAADALISANRPEDAAYVATQALKLAESESDQVWKVARLLRVADVFERAGNADEAKTAIETARPCFDELNAAVGTGEYFPYSPHVTHLVRALTTRKEFELAAHVAEKWTLDWDQVQNLGAVAHALLETTDKTSAEKLVNRILDTFKSLAAREESSAETRGRVEPERSIVRVQLAQLLAEFGRKSEAVAIAEAITDPTQQRLGFALVAQALASLGREKEAREIVGRSISVADPTALRSPIEMETAAAVLRALWQHGTKQQAARGTTLAGVLADNADRTEWRGRQALAEFAKAQSAVDPQASIRLIESVDDKAYKAKELAELASAMTAAGRQDSAVSVAEQALALVSTIEIDDDPELVVLAKVALGLVDVGSGAHAEALLERLKDRFASPRPGDESKVTTALLLTVSSVARLGRLEEALDLANTISSATASALRKKVEAYKTLADHFLSSGEVDRARRVAELAVEAANLALNKDREEHDIFGNAFMALVKAAQALAATGESRRASALAQYVLDAALEQRIWRRTSC